MTPGSEPDGTLVSIYRNRIGEPSTGDEAQGYWIFALGVILGIVGIWLFVRSRPAGGLRQWAIIVASAGLVLLVAGPLIRLPLRRTATWLVYIGALVCAAAIVWFVMAFPAQWNPQSGQPTIISLYAAGMLLMAVAGVFVPIITSGPEQEAALRGLEAERDDARAGLADTAADEADLAAQLRAIRSSQAQFELYEDKGDQWRWRLRHRNGNVIAAAGEGYTRKHNAQKGMTSVRRNALGATVLLIEREEELPEAGSDEGFIFPEVVESQASFELYEDNAGKSRWRLRHENGDIIADSGQGYASRQGAQKSITGVTEYVGPANYLRADPTAFEIYLNQAAEWSWRLIHRNGNILADGGEGYANRTGARRAVDRIQDRIDEMEFEVYEDAAGEFRWRLRGGNNQIMADSGQGYESEDGAEQAVESVTEYAPDAAVLDIGRAVFEVYEDVGGEFRWRLRHRNGNILADGGKGYSDRSGAWAGIESVKRHGPNADIQEQNR